jgi:hypothetical protein
LLRTSAFHIPENAQSTSAALANKTCVAYSSSIHGGETMKETLLFSPRMIGRDLARSLERLRHTAWSRNRA